MKNIFKTSKRGIIVILTLCILLGIAGTCVNIVAMAVEQTIVTDENTQELVPRMARACWGTLEEALNYYIGKNNWSYDANGSPQASGFNIYVSNGYCRVTGNDVSYSFYFG